jgi:tRNA (guanine37-N1)-methyltransferase
MRFDVITLFPPLFSALNIGIIGRAIASDHIQCHFWNPRDYSNNVHGYVDDKPYGGGAGMVMCYQPLADTLAAIQEQTPRLKNKVVCLTPHGKPFTQQTVPQATSLEQLILVCGRYDGMDQRFIDHHVDECWSLGEFILSGGEFAACCIIDAITRQIPGVLGNPASLIKESYSEPHFLSHPVYTRPSVIDGHAVPEVLLSGDHKAIDAWQRAHQKTTNLDNPNET